MLVTPQQSADGEDANASDINTPINQLAAVINGNIDSANIAANGVITNNLADRSVTAVKLGTGATVRIGLNTKTSTATLIPMAYTDYCTITGNSTGGEVELDYRASIADGNSGAARTGHVRVQCDGTTIPGSDMIYQTVSSGARAYVSLIISHTPTSGQHTWKLQVQADTASATNLDQASLRIAETRS